jgi:hypothetical protein
MSCFCIKLAGLALYSIPVAPEAQIDTESTRLCNRESNQLEYNLNRQLYTIQSKYESVNFDVPRVGFLAPAWTNQSDRVIIKFKFLRLRPQPPKSTSLLFIPPPLPTHPSLALAIQHLFPSILNCLEG